MSTKELIAWGVTTSLVLSACGSKIAPTVEAQNNINPLDTPTPEFIPSLIPPSPTSTPDAYTQEVLDNSWMTNPGAKENAIINLEQSADYESLVQTGNLSEKALYSSAEITFGDYRGNAVMLHVKDWWVVLTAGHMIEGQSMFLVIDRDKDGLPNRSSVYFPDVGSAYIYNKDSDFQDFGVIVIPDQIGSESLSEMFDLNKILSWEDLDFSDTNINIGQLFHGLCSYQHNRPHLASGTLTGSKFQTQDNLDNILISATCSGTGLFDATGKYKGVLVGGIDPLPTDDPAAAYYYDDAWLTSLYSIGGEEGLKNLIKQAQNEFLGK